MKHLTDREKEVVALLATGDCGDGYVGIARALGITPRTARNHIDNIAKKLDGPGRGYVRVLRYALTRHAA